MPNDANLPANENPSSAAEDDDDYGSWWQDLFGSKGGILLLGGGLFLILCNIVIFAGIDLRPSAWLFYLNLRYWSIYFSLFLWIAAIWLVSELTDLVEDYRPLVRLCVATCLLLVIVFSLRNAWGVSGPATQDHPFWIDIALVVASFCVVRSLFLFYDYRYEGGENIDLEETQWFWAVSGFLLAGLLTLGVMHIIPVTTQIHAGLDAYVTESLLTSCIKGFQDMLRSGTGSFALRAFGLLFFVAAIAFVYVAGKWALIFLFKLKEKWA